MPHEDREPGRTARDLVRTLARGGRGRSAEAFVTVRERRSVTAVSGRPEEIAGSRSTAASVRVLSGGAMTTAGSSDLSPRGRDALVRTVGSLRGLADPDPFAVLPKAGNPVRGGELDAALVSLSREDMEDLAIRLERAALAKGISRVHRATVSVRVEDVAVVSTRGVDAGFRRSLWSLSVSAIASDRGAMVTAWEGADGARLAGIDPEAVGRSAAEEALAKRRGRRCPTGRFPVLFSPLAAISLLELLGQAASAEAVILGRSFLAGRLGRRWCSRGVTVVDDASIEGGYGSRPADDEGVATGRTVLIREGIVAGYLHNARTAAFMEMSSTGSAVRPSPFAPPSVGTSNLALRPGRGETLVDAGAAIEVTDLLGLHTANPVTGELSVGIEGFWLENGRRKHPVRGGALGTSVGEIFGTVIALGRESRSLGGVSSPAFVAGPLAVSG